ncbi:MAG: transglutaminase [Flavobacterium psychrophilum]|nr:MAG: transglutaminase [Flavobacterium psychrophilum]
MKLLNTLLFFFMAVLPASAQQYELGEVTKEELEENKHPVDPSAGAAILFSKGKTYMSLSEQSGFDLVTEVEMKIKIYTKEGYDWATKTIPLYVSGSSRESVDISKAVTYNLEGGAIKKSKLKSEGEFSEAVNKYWNSKKIIMPDVKEGSIIEYKYTLKSPFISVFPDWRFQEDIPVNYSSYTTVIPEYYVYNPVFRGYYSPKITRSSKNTTYNYTSKERTGWYVSKTTYENGQINYKENTTTYVLDKLVAMKEEAFVNNIANYTASIEHELSMTKYPNEPIKTFSSSWEDVAKTIYKYDDFGPELEKTGYFENDLASVLAGTSTQEEKAYAIFSFVKNRMNWNEYYGYSCEGGVKKAYKDKTGNTAEINLMLTAMLRSAGLNANPVLVSTRNNKIALFPNRTAFNYVIASVDIDGKMMLLDATSKAALPNIIPTRAINWFGRLIRKDGSSANIDLMPQQSSREVVNIFATVGADGKITGKAKDQYLDYNAFVFREHISNVNKEVYLETLEKKLGGIQVSNYNVSDKDFSKPVIEDFDFVHDNMTDIIGDKIYLNPMLFFTQKENPFKSEKRDYPIDFVYPHQDKYMINITLPAGYVIESMPKAATIVMEENIGSFKYNIASSNNTIQIGVVLDINAASLAPDYYLTIKDFYAKMIEKQNEKIVLKKA